MANQASLTNPSVLSGSTIVLNGARVNYKFKPLTKTIPLVNAFTLAESQTAGFENPLISITGYIDTNNLSATSIQHSSLLAFSKVPYDGTASTATTLSITTGNNSSPLYATDTSTSTIKVIVEDFNVSIDTADADEGHFWVYNLNLRETL